MPFYRGNGVAWVLEGGNDTSDATATPEDIKLGKTAYIAEGKVEGTSYIAIELTQAEYDALSTKDSNTYYLIKEEPSYPTNVVVFKSDSPRTITPKFTQSGVTLQYSIDNGSTWNNISSGATTASSDEIWFRGRATGTKSLYTPYTSSSNAWVFSGDASNKLRVYGDLRYLLCDNLGDNTITFNIANRCYAFMFYGCTSLTTAPSLPATTLATDCYNGMFSGCTALILPPALPATTLATDCYNGMFSGCTALTSPPALPATTLASGCYGSMFQGCTGLMTTPSLPATTLASRCYSYMFYGCTSLTTAPSLPATTLADYCYFSMFEGCTSLASAPALPATTLASDCYRGMFSGCRALTSAPALPATTLASYCYQYMFYGCTALTSAPALPATTLADYCYKKMFQGCTSLKISSTQTETYQYVWRIPTSGTGTTATDWNADMFLGTGGAFTGDPEINKTYYVENPPVV